MNGNESLLDENDGEATAPPLQPEQVVLPLESIQLQNYAARQQIPLFRVSNEKSIVKTYWLSEKKKKTYPSKKIVILDLDNTLLTTKPKWRNAIVENRKPPDALVDLLTWQGAVWLRPGAREFIKLVCEHFETYLFTASDSVYADAVVDGLLDPDRNLLLGRFYRPALTTVGGGVGTTKDIETVMHYIGKIDRKKTWLSRTVLIDDLDGNFCFHPKNGLEIFPFESPFSEQDRELKRVYDALLHMDRFADVRPFLRYKKYQMQQAKARKRHQDYAKSIKKVLFF